MKQSKNIKEFQVEDEKVVLLRPELAITEDKETNSLKAQTTIKGLYSKESQFYEFYYLQKPTVA